MTAGVCRDLRPLDSGIVMFRILPVKSPQFMTYTIPAHAVPFLNTATITGQMYGGLQSFPRKELDCKPQNIVEHFNGALKAAGYIVWSHEI